MYEVLEFSTPDHHRACVNSDKLIGFASIDRTTIRIFLDGGGQIDIKGGSWEFEKLSQAIRGKEIINKIEIN